METWRDLGDRAKLASYLATKLAPNLVTILATLVTKLASSGPSGFLQIHSLPMILSGEFNFNISFPKAQPLIAFLNDEHSSSK
ncbi:hypothetical protein TNCV_23601 [Trichonephila clavipes]|nr:hypothetical protein TNCV_23601 [Trichonephila clavipes]